MPAGDGPGGQGRAGPLLLEQPKPGAERGGLSEGVLLFHGQRSTSPDPPSPQDSELLSGRFSSPQAKREGQLSSCEGMKCLGHRTWHLVFTESTGGPHSSCGSWCPQAHGPHHPQPGISRPGPCPWLAHPVLQSSKRPLSWIVCSCISESLLCEGEDPEDEDSARGKQRPQRAWEGSPEEATSGGWRRPECETKGSCGWGAEDAGLGAGAAPGKGKQARQAVRKTDKTQQKAADRKLRKCSREWDEKTKMEDREARKTDILCVQRRRRRGPGGQQRGPQARARPHPTRTAAAPPPPRLQGSGPRSRPCSVLGASFVCLLL